MGGQGGVVESLRQFAGISVLFASDEYAILLISHNFSIAVSFEIFSPGVVS